MPTVLITLAGSRVICMPINLTKILHDLHEKQAREDSRLLPTPSTKREPSKTESQAIFTPANFGLLFCPHSKSYFDTCSACRRDRKRAKAEYEAFLKRHGIPQ